MSEEENEIIHIISNCLMYCRGYETKKFTEKELFEALGKVGPLLEERHNEIEKQQKKIENNKKFKKDIVNLIMLWDKEKLPENNMIIETLKTIISELSRLEDIEDRKIQVAVKFVEEKRDKYWKDKIKKILDNYIKIDDFTKSERIDLYDLEVENFKKELLEENNND